MSAITHPASTAELAWIAPAALRAHLVEDHAELVQIVSTEPWRVRATPKGEAALLAPWRAHLDYCAVLGLWCSPRRVPVLVTDLLDVARVQGFGRLVGPLVPEGASRPYLDAGLRVVQRVLVMRVDLRQRAASVSRDRAQAPTEGRDGRSPETVERVPGLTVREADTPDLPDLLAVDTACFEPFWRYDRAGLEHLARTSRLAVAELGGSTVGYTLATSRGTDGSLGRLAVSPSMRGRGIGRALAEDAVDWMVRHGARSAILSTQADNMASRSLYRAMGFSDTGDVLVACASSGLERGTGEGR